MDGSSHQSSGLATLDSEFEELSIPKRAFFRHGADYPSLSARTGRFGIGSSFVLWRESVGHPFEGRPEFQPVVFDLILRDGGSQIFGDLRQV
ncbi:MAG: hypothetical protein CMJ33_08145, partial [Phycisphaerae bacterium]|nr:hypothetical protein [Phycisphaerae bacterium]